MGRGETEGGPAVVDACWDCIYPGGSGEVYGEIGSGEADLGRVLVDKQSQNLTSEQGRTGRDRGREQYRVEKEIRNERTRVEPRWNPVVILPSIWYGKGASGPSSLPTIRGRPGVAIVSWSSVAGSSCKGLVSRRAAIGEGQFRDYM